MLSTRRLVHVSKGCVGSRHLRGSTRRAETSVPSISGRRFPRVGSATDCGVRVVRQHGNPAYGSGKCDRTDRAVRHDRLRERRPEKPGVDDSLAGGSARDSATGRSRARDETRPTDLGREGPETCSVTGRVSSCGEASPFTARRMSLQIEILPPFKILEPDTQLELRPSTRICEVLCKLRRFFFCVVCQSELLFYCRPVTDGVDYCTVERIIFREIFFKFDLVL